MRGSTTRRALGYEDDTHPTPGESFFYLFRTASAEDYGESSDGHERLPADGDRVEPLPSDP